MAWHRPAPRRAHQYGHHCLVSSAGPSQRLHLQPGMSQVKATVQWLRIGHSQFSQATSFIDLSSTGMGGIIASVPSVW